jgi:competence protein CoiA
LQIRGRFRNIVKRSVIFILTAKQEDGTIIILSSQMRREQLREWRKSKLFFCPGCNETVHLKVGDIVIPHFAHKKDKSCSASFSEGESKEHLQGKHDLFNFFQTIGVEVKLEPYFNALAQRPDLLVTNETEQIPIEFQCSTIPIKQIKSRSAGYKKAGMTPIWILHTPRKIMALPQGVGIFQLSEFEKSFLTETFPKGIIFLTYNPQFERFHYFSSLLHVAGRQYIGLHRTLPISKQIFPFAKPKIPSDDELERYAMLFLTMRKNFLQNRILHNRRGVNDPFLRDCYELRILPSELPSWIGIPVSYINPFREHPCEWQLAFVHFLHRWKLDVHTISDDHLYNFVEKFEGPTDSQLKACINYRDFLLSLKMKSIDNIGNFEEKQFIEILSHKFLAK